MSNLTKQQSINIKRMLSSRYLETVTAIREAFAQSGEQHYIDLAGKVTDPGDESVADLLADMDAAIIDHHIQEIRDIEAAQKRLEEGKFGICIDCGQTIDYERLKAYPTAKRCFLCQSQHEKTYRQESGPTL